MIAINLSADETSTVIACMLRSSRPSTVPVVDIDSAVKKIEDAQEAGTPVNLTFDELDAIFQCMNTLRRDHQIAGRPAYDSALLRISNERAEEIIRRGK